MGAAENTVADDALAALQGRFEIKSSEQRLLIAAEWQCDLLDSRQ
jgi:hypothetical protein